jgi:multidrug efflux pump subunit AcrA (membrane-fusion protein)
MVIIQLRPEQQQAAVNAAIANVNAQQASLTTARAEVRVAEAELSRLAAEVKGQEANLQSRNADLELAKLNFGRAKDLVAQGAQPQQSLDDRTRERDNAIAAHRAAVQSLAAAQKALAAAQSRLSASQATVKQGQAGLSLAQSDIQASVENLNYNRVVAPIPGIVGDIPVKVGDYVNIGQELTSIIQNNLLDLRIAIPTERMPQLQMGVPVRMLDTQNRVVATGRVSFIAPRVDTNAQSILAKATFSNPTGRLRDGQYVRVKVIWSQRPGVLIPTTAVSQVGPRILSLSLNLPQKRGNPTRSLAKNPSN